MGVMGGVSLSGSTPTRSHLATVALQLRVALHEQGSGSAWDRFGDWVVRVARGNERSGPPLVFGGISVGLLRAGVRRVEAVGELLDQLVAPMEGAVAEVVEHRRHPVALGDEDGALLLALELEQAGQPHAGGSLEVVVELGD